METKDNKYLKWYWNICENAKTRVKPEGYTEKHHIYPKSIYGQNKDLVTLTAKEHFIVHLCLWQGLKQKYGTKDSKTRKMCYAFTAMNMKNKYSGQRYDCKLYSFLSEAARDLNQGENNWMYGRKGKDAPMYGRCAYDIWLEKYGKEEADRRLSFTKNKMSLASKGIQKSKEFCKKVSLRQTGENNSMYGRNRSDIWLEKYGKEEADRRFEIWKKKQQGENNPMYGRCAYDIWLEKYGKEEADRRQLLANKKNSESHKGEKSWRFGKDLNAGENNPMYGTGGFYPIWVEKYGKEEADRKLQITIQKRKETLKNKKNKNGGSDQRIL